MRQQDKGVTRYIVLAALAAAIGYGGYRLATSDSRNVTVDVSVPELSQMALRGKDAFDANCAECHGTNASGTEQGPPLVHKLYNPGHHSDEAFLRAAQYGVRQHHWSYGDMPAQPQVSAEEVADIVRYVRELQLENDITTEPHTM